MVPCQISDFTINMKTNIPSAELHLYFQNGHIYRYDCICYFSYFCSYQPHLMIEDTLLHKCLATNTCAEIVKVLNNFLNLMIYPDTTVLKCAWMVQKQLSAKVMP